MAGRGIVVVDKEARQTQRGEVVGAGETLDSRCGRVEGENVPVDWGPILQPVAGRAPVGARGPGPVQRRWRQTIFQKLKGGPKTRRWVLAGSNRRCRSRTEHGITSRREIDPETGPCR